MLIVRSWQHTQSKGEESVMMEETSDSSRKLNEISPQKSGRGADLKENPRVGDVKGDMKGEA